MNSGSDGPNIEPVMRRKWTVRNRNFMETVFPRFIEVYVLLMSIELRSLDSQKNVFHLTNTHATKVNTKSFRATCKKFAG